MAIVKASVSFKNRGLIESTSSYKGPSLYFPVGQKLYHTLEVVYFWLAQQTGYSNQDKFCGGGGEPYWYRTVLVSYFNALHWAIVVDPFIPYSI